jgi:glycosyltransferase involved in cell wall biosynthesis
VESLAAQPNRITLVISSLGSGGAERVLSTMANFWVEHGRAVTLITLAAAGEDFYPIDSRVQRVALDVLGASTGAIAAARNNLRRLQRVRSAVLKSRPDAVLSFIDRTNVLVLLALTGTGIPVVVSERIDPRVYSSGAGWDRARALVYRRAAGVVVQTAAVRGWAETLISQDRVTVIPNPLSSPPAAQEVDSTDADVPKPYVLAVGRLVPQKGFDILLRCFANATLDLPRYKLVILGEGPERTDLTSQAVQLGIAERTHLPGTVSNVHGWMKHAELFVLSSRFEGFPNALLEAMSASLPVVSFDCPSGPSELITSGVDGMLVPPEDEEQLTASMRELLRDASKRKELGENAQRSSQRFALTQVMAQWDATLSAAMRNK